MTSIKVKDKSLNLTALTERDELGLGLPPAKCLLGFPERKSPLLALSGHPTRPDECPLWEKSGRDANGPLCLLMTHSGQVMSPDAFGNYTVCCIV